MSRSVRRVALLFGGRSAEHRVSLASAASIARLANREEIQILPVLIGTGGEWTLLKTPEDPPGRGLRITLKLEPGSPALVEFPGGTAHPFDIAFPLIHGPGGEDGALQGILELAEIPFVGAGVAASANGMDKELTKVICRAADVPVVDWVTLGWETHRCDPEAVQKCLLDASLRPPLFVKPAALGSSVGVSRVAHEREMQEAVATAFRYHHRVLVERAVEGREIEASVLGNTTGEGAAGSRGAAPGVEKTAPVAAAPMAEIRPRGGWYDYERKYTDGATEIVVPAELPEDLAEQIRTLAVRAYRALGADGMARVDFLLDTSSGKPEIYLNELNTIPGFTATSVYPKLWEAAGLPYPELITRLVELGLARRRFLDRFAAARGVEG
ncbi:MAG: D-alanine--D-alanine ligase family protein [Nitrospinota bacterium]